MTNQSNEDIPRLLREAPLERPEAIMFLRRKAADEIERLTAALKTASGNHEHFEREWYLRGDEIERLTDALERAQHQMTLLLGRGSSEPSEPPHCWRMPETCIYVECKTGGKCLRSAEKSSVCDCDSVVHVKDCPYVR